MCAQNVKSMLIPMLAHFIMTEICCRGNYNLKKCWYNGEMLYTTRF